MMWSFRTAREGDRTLRPNTPGTVYLIQDISLKLRKGMDTLDRRAGWRSTTSKKMTYRKLAEDTGISLSTINDLLQGKAWPTVETVANLEMFLEWRLWTKVHIDLVTPKGRLPPQRGVRNRARPSAAYRRRQASDIPPSIPAPPPKAK